METLLTTLSVFLCIFMPISSSSSSTTTTTDTLLANQSLSDGQTLTSSDHTFQLGFFSPPKSKNRYLGIWFKNSNSTVVWVANRANPISDSSATLTFQSDGNLAIFNGTKTRTLVWSSNLTRRVENPVAQILWTGNLVLKNGVSEGLIVWRSFDYPVDTLLVGVNITRHKDLVSWKTPEDPSPGHYSFSIDVHGLTQLVLRNASAKRFRTGPWNGLEFPGLDYFLFNPSFAPSFRSGTQGGELVYRRIVLSPSGWLQRLTWNYQSREWDVLNSVPQEDCDKYGFCGANGVCDMGKSPVCECLPGFTPKNWQEWGRMDWRGGCVRRTELENGGRDGFLAIQKLKMPDVLDYWTGSDMSLAGCRTECLRNGSCVAYANSDISEGGKGCIMWFGDLMDIRLLEDDGVQQLYLKLASSDIGDGNAEDDDLDLPLYDWTTIATATSNFSLTNKIGEGGFGPVYKYELQGKLVEGQEIAVKRLSMDSGQGNSEFKNEAWTLWKEGKAMEIMDIVLEESCIPSESFEYPSDNLIEGMKFGRNLKTGLNRKLQSWKSSDDPSNGDLVYEIVPNGFPEPVLRNGSVKLFRAGPWTGIQFSGTPELTDNPVFRPSFVFDNEEAYFSFKSTDGSVISRLLVTSTGSLYRLIWNSRSLQWVVMTNVLKDQCNKYGLCGVHGVCNIDEAVVCKCLKGFEPKSPEDWSSINWSGGCRRRTGLNCSNGVGDDGFVRFSSVKVPDTTFTWVNMSMGLGECHVKCLMNCSCMAYANSDVRGSGSGCVLWFGDLVDIREFAAGGGQDLYVRMAASVIGEGDINQEEESTRDLELPLHNFVTVANATNNFSHDKVIGEGGFGPVYKGILQNGQEIAVKRLSKNSGQGLEEFKNEAWNLWNEDRVAELIDEMFTDQDVSSRFSVLRCIHIGLLCVQQRPDDRPTMPTVVMMLGSATANLPQPKRPGFYYERSFMDEGQSSSEKFSYGNKVSFTQLEGR
ncbi:hypothetical protein Scep_013215 [Stephania cephalantha]|uniref:non-specific serine/threonine protein kinase n=1 Tax=Stephania cephalantha TaxID=152367 RepID=A0AAP0P773_9MAGN